MTESGTWDGEIDTVVDAQWVALAGSGTWFDGRGRVAIARAARSRMDDAPPSPDPALAAGRRVGNDAATLTAEDVDAWEAAGLTREAYVEVVGIASRVAAIDTFDRALGRAARRLPDPRPGEPTRAVDAAAKRRAGWVPSVGAISPPSALTAVPAEAEAQRELHSVLYLSYEDMADLDAASGLHRTQMELVASRLSLLNDCFF